MSHLYFCLGILAELTVAVFLLIEKIRTVDVNFTRPYKPVTPKFIILLIETKKVKFKSVHSCWLSNEIT